MSFCGKCYDWRTIEGLQLVMHNVVYHYQKFGYRPIFCGRSMLKRVRNVTEMVPWRRLVACYSCFMLYNVYVCLHFAAMCDNLHRTVISHSLSWNSSRFGVIFSIHDHAVSANRILWVYAGFWWYHGILVVHLQDSVGAFWAIKDQDTSIRGLSVENVMTDGLSRVCIWWCIMLSLITKITGIYLVGEKC